MAGRVVVGRWGWQVEWWGVVGMAGRVEWGGGDGG